MAFDLTRPLLRSLSLRDDLSPAEQRLLAEMPLRFRTYGRGDELVRQHSRPTESCVLITGLATRSVELDDGRRQLTSMHIAGDFVDLHALLLKKMDHSVVALSDCQAGFVGHHHLVGLVERAPHLGRLLWLSTVVDAAIHRAWLTSLGRRSAASHIAHLLCETGIRLASVGLGQRDAFTLPITQADLADMVGMSIVHVNRTLKELREAGLATWENSQVRIADFDRLAATAEFDPTYLNLIKEPR